MNIPEPEDLRRIERAHFREVMHRKLPIARQALADASAARQAKEATMSKTCTMFFDRTDQEDVDLACGHLDDTFGEEWYALSLDASVNVLVDFCRMVVDENWDSVSNAAREYRDRIGVGNLANYARCGLLHEDEGTPAHEIAKSVALDHFPEDDDVPHGD